MSTRPTIKCTFWFASRSGNGTYETLLYTDGGTSCCCPGWCRRVSSDGSRTCKHTRMVEAGLGESRAENYQETGKNPGGTGAVLVSIKSTPAPRKKKTTPPPALGHRKMILN